MGVLAWRAALDRRTALWKTALLSAALTISPADSSWRERESFEYIQSILYVCIYATHASAALTISPAGARSSARARGRRERGAWPTRRRSGREGGTRACRAPRGAKIVVGRGCGGARGVVAPKPVRGRVLISSSWCSDSRGIVQRWSRHR